MDINHILEVKLYNPNLIDDIEISKNHDYGLLSIDGIDSGEIRVGLNENVLFDGSIVSNRRLTHRNIVVEAEYKGKHKLDERKRVIKFFNLHHNGWFSIKLGNDRYKIPYVVEDFRAPIPNIYNPFRFRVSLICPDPFFTDYEDGNYDIVSWKKGLHFPLQIPKKRGFVFGSKVNKSDINIYNNGDVDSGFIATFKSNGEVVNPHLINTDTRETIQINKTMTKGEIFIVDTHPGNKGVEMINAKEGANGYRFLSEDSEFFQLKIGDNILKFGADEGVGNLEVSIQFTNKYLGV